MPNSFESSSPWMRVDTNIYQKVLTDKVGIGTTTPATALHVYDGVSNSGVTIDGLAAGNPYISFKQANTQKSYIQYIDSTDYLRIDGAGNEIAFMNASVGIGIIAPITPLHVYRSGVNGVGAASVITVDTDAKTVNDAIAFLLRGLDSADTTTNYGAFGHSITNATDGAEASSFFVQTRTGGGSLTTRLTIDGSGNLGIGIASPAQRMDVVGQTLLYGSDTASETTRTNVTNKIGRLWVPHYTNAEEPMFVIAGATSISGNVLSIGGSSSLTNAATQIDFYTAANNTTVTGTVRMTISSAGDLGINTTPSYGLDIVQPSGVNNTPQILLSHITTDATNKNFVMGGRHYTNSEEPVGIFLGASTVSSTIMAFGGGSSAMNAITDLRFYTAANNTTVSGTTAVNINPSGFTAFGLGTTAGATIIDAQGADNSTVVTVRINATQANVTAADTFIDFRSTTGSEGSIAGTGVAGVIAYNTFTGSHYTQIDDKTRIIPGMLLEMVEGSSVWPEVDKMVTQTTLLGDEDGVKQSVSRQSNIKDTPSQKDYLSRARICQTRASKAAYGAYGGTDMIGRDLVLALGTGILLVANKGMNIEIGDYLMSSDVFGCAELQVNKDGSKDDMYRNITVAKATQNVVWNVGEVTRMVNVIYEGG